MKVRHWGPLRILDMTPSLKLAGTTANHDYRQVVVSMRIGISHAAAKEVDRVVQQRTFTVGRGPQLLQEVSEERYMVRINLRQLCELPRVVPVMRHRVMGLGHS